MAVKFKEAKRMLNEYKKTQELIGKVSMDRFWLDNSQKIVVLQRVFESYNDGSYIVPDFVGALGGNSLYESNVRKLILGKNVTTLRNNALLGSKYLETIVFNRELQMICEYAFVDCRKLREIEIPDTVKIIGENAFTECHSLKRLVVPNSVRRCDEQTLFCNLEYLQIPSRLKSSFRVSGEIKEVLYT